MSKKHSIQPRIKDAAVAEKTGKNWREWFLLLDKIEADKMNHQEIVALVHTKYNIGPWWQQMIAVTYEQYKGMRGKYEKPSGYQISVSRTVPMTVAAAYALWKDSKKLKDWLGVRLRQRTAQKNKSIRLDWEDKKSIIEVRFYSKAKNKTQIVVQHDKLENGKKISSMKRYWQEKIKNIII